MHILIVLILLLISQISTAYASKGCTDLVSSVHHSVKQVSQFEGYRFFGSNVYPQKNGSMVRIWLPGAKQVEVVSDINGWKENSFPLSRTSSGIWEGFVPELRHGSAYKFKILDYHGQVQFRTDPYARFLVPDGMGGWKSIVWNPETFVWNDSGFTPAKRISIYEAHAGTIVPGKKNASWRDIADYLVPILKENSITHLELMPVFHHNVYESWGYQPGGIYAIDFRHGNPDDFKYLVNLCHKNGIAVILDIVHSHASKDWNTGLSGIDGTEPYFHEGIMGHHPHWDTRLYNYARPEVQSFLISNALYWLREYHVDGFRFDGLSSMIYLDYGRNHGEWIANPDGSNIHHAALDYVRAFNTEVKRANPSAITIAEESSGYGGVTLPVSQGGLGFDYKWNMGGMHHIRKFLKAPPEHRNVHHLMQPMEWNERMVNYANSHDEASHGDRLFIDTVFGARLSDFDRFRMFRMVSSLIALVWRGRPMIFQGDEFANRGWWDENSFPQTHLLVHDFYKKQSMFMRSLGEFYKTQQAYKRDDVHSYQDLMRDNEGKVVVVARFGKTEEDTLIIIQNWGGYKPSYNVPVLSEGNWQVVFNSDSLAFGGQGDSVTAGKVTRQYVYDNPLSLSLMLPPRTTIVLKKNRSK